MDQIENTIEQTIKGIVGGRSNMISAGITATICEAIWQHFPEIGMPVVQSFPDGSWLVSFPNTGDIYSIDGAELLK